jgi:anti-sigma regulatory factor (Ser/Thr protein kinase)
VSSAAAEAVTRYQQTFPGRADRVAWVRREMAAYLGGCPAADDAVLIVSEIVSNAIVHSASNGESFTVRCETFRDYVWIECEDLGGPWHCSRPDDRPHGLDIIEALAGPDNWGTDTTGSGSRIVWARLDLHRQAGPA